MNIDLAITEDVALITMDDGKKNAITVEALKDLNAALDKAEADARAIVLSGRPGSFCAGFDLNVMTGGDMNAIIELGTGGGRLATRLYGMGMPLVAACTGHAFTIGAFWLLACDTRIGERGNFKMGFNETKMGMPLTGWPVELLKARINPTRFVATVAQAEIYDPESAIDVGLLDSVVNEGASVEAALAKAAEFAALPAEAYAANKLIVRQEALEIMRKDVGA